MIAPLFQMAGKMLGSALLRGLPLWGLKAIRRFIDGALRDKVRPVPGCVVYCDLIGFVEHSGVYHGQGKIVNIAVDGVAESEVRLSNPIDFTSKSLTKHIYVSCDADGAVGHEAIAKAAASRLGERAFYGLVIHNCHQFVTDCLRVIPAQSSLLSEAWGLVIDVLDGPTDPTFVVLKRAARQRLGATKWKLWSWQDEDEEEPPMEPDWEAMDRFYENLPLTPETLGQVRRELEEASAYAQELEDEPLPERIRQRLLGFIRLLHEIDETAKRAEGLLLACPGAGLTLGNLRRLREDFTELAAQLRHNPRIRELVNKLGRDHISPALKRRERVPRISRNETHGVHLSDELTRLLPAELLKLDDETLELLFYAHLAEKKLLTYELKGIEHVEQEVETEQKRQRTGPVVACLDTSGSMEGLPSLKAKALLLATANILKQEGRRLHVLLFGASGELREFSLDDARGIPGLLDFLGQGFGGGTDYETPLRRALELIEAERDYQRADILMISDGAAGVSTDFARWFTKRKVMLDCSVYSVRVAQGGGLETFSDELEVI